jgi:ATP-dependent DNA ligase
MKSPAVLLAFDLVRDAGVELVDLPLRERRRHLEVLLGPGRAFLQLVAQTASVELAEEWLTFVPALEGVVAKRCDGRYVPGQRDWIKVKRQRTADCAVIGIAGDRARPALVPGLRHADGQLHHFGVARPAKHMLSRELYEVLARAGPQQQPIQSRWQHAAVPTWWPVPPTTVCEVAYTVLDAGRWLRQPARFVRWRPDRSPDDCWLDQLAET